MKKLLFIPILVLTLFVSMNNVKAYSTYQIYIDDYKFDENESISSTKSLMNNTSVKISSAFQTIYNIYSSSYSQSYPYYYVSAYFSNPSEGSYQDITISLHYLTTPLSIQTTASSSNLTWNGSVGINCFGTSTCSTFTDGSSEILFYYKNGSSGSISGYYGYFFSNFDYFVYSTDNSIGLNFGTNPIERATLIDSNTPLPTMYDFYDLTFLSDYDVNTYEEVNLNNYAYIVLSLNSYSNLISPVEYQYIGEPCITPVYDFGQTQKQSNTNVCQINQTSWAYSKLYVLDTDLQNNVVYYVTPYDRSHDNKITVNTRVFTINYVTQENENTPYIIADGKQYPVLPYSSISNSTSINTENGFIPGESYNVFDVSSDSSFLSELFSNPLSTLTTVWGTILTMFSLIGSFIGILPVTLQAFLFTAFSLAIVLGILKILL